MTIVVRHSPDLQTHLETFEVDGTTVAATLFHGGRLAYPGRKDLEQSLGYTEPYTIQHESRVIEGLPRNVRDAVLKLAEAAQHISELDPTLELLWEAHSSWRAHKARVDAVSGDRLVTALAIIQLLTLESDLGAYFDETYDTKSLASAATKLLTYMHSVGLPPSSESLEEIFDGAPPASVGLGLVDIDWT